MPKFVLNPLLPANLQQLQNNLADLDTKNHSDLDQLAWSLAGHTIDTDIDLAGNDLLNVGTLNINATIDHTITDSSDNLVITNNNEDEDIIFNINRGGTSADLLKLSASEGLLRLTAASGSYGLSGLFNITGTQQGTGLTAGLGFNPTVTGTPTYWIVNLAQPVINAQPVVLAYYLAPTWGATYNQNLESLRTVFPSHKVGYNDTIKIITEQTFPRTIFALGTPDTSSITINQIILGGAASIGEFGGVAAPAYTETMITLTGGGTRTFGTGGSLNQKGIKFTGFGTRSGLIAGTDSCYALYADGGLFHFHDNTKLVLGTGDDSEIYYNGTDLIVDTNVVGSGTLDLAGQSASAITTEGLSEYVTIKIGGVSKKIAIVA